MKKILLALLLVSGIVQAEVAIDPKDDGPFESGRLVQQRTTGAPAMIITDLKTGCQFLVMGGDSHTAAPMGCFPELINPKFKK